MRARCLFVAVVAWSTACVARTPFTCTDDAQCISQSAQLGVCQPSGFCSFPDASCVARGQRYGAAAPADVANTCVAQTDAGTTCNGCVEPSGGPYNYAFATSKTFIPGTLGGIAAARAECQALADNAGIGLPDRHYVAWISDSTTSALTQLAGARGWVRTDGLPFVDTPGELTAGRMFFPLRVDEAGHDLLMPGAMSPLAATGTLSDGTSSAATCGDWSDTTKTYTAGSIAATTNYWSFPVTSDRNCALDAHLYCFGIDFDHALVRGDITGRMAFVSDGTFTPSAGGIATADALCQSEAAMFADMLRPGTDSTSFLALLSTQATAAADRFEDGATWVRADQAPWVRTASDLGLARFLTPLNMGLDRRVHAPVLVWTGATSPRDKAATAAENCGDWMMSGSTGIGGRADLSDVNAFHQGGVSACNMAQHVYCLER